MKKKSNKRSIIILNYKNKKKRRYQQHRQTMTMLTSTTKPCLEAEMEISIRFNLDTKMPIGWKIMIGLISPSWWPSSSSACSSAGISGAKKMKNCSSITFWKSFKVKNTNMSTPCKKRKVMKYGNTESNLSRKWFGSLFWYLALYFIGAQRCCTSCLSKTAFTLYAEWPLLSFSLRSLGGIMSKS